MPTADYRKYCLNKREKIFLIGASIGVATGMGWLFYDRLIGVVLSPAIFLLLKKPLEGMLLERRKKKLRNQFKDVLYSFSSSFASGAHMEEAMYSASVQIKEVYGEESDLYIELTNMIKSIRETGAGDISLWEDFATRSGIEDIRDFASVFAACRDAGGDLVSAVDKASSIIVEKINIENEMRTLFSQKKMEGRMMTGMPVVMILFLRITSPGYLEIMYSTTQGRILMTLAVGLIGYAVYLTEKITRVNI